MRADDSALRRPAPRPYARARVVLFPHGGGSASYYRSWTESAPWDVEFAAVQYPGREDRFAEPVPPDMRGLVDVVAAGLRHDGPRLPVVLFGHSMGAIVAYEMARRLTSAGDPPAALVVSGHPAPHLSRPGQVHRAGDDDLIEELRRTEAGRLDVLDNAELMRTYLPVIRADYRLSETYRPLYGTRLRVPVTVLYGERDPEVTAAEAEGWRDATDGTVDCRVFPGGHFYLDDHREPVVELLTARARAASVTAAAPWPSAP